MAEERTTEGKRRKLREEHGTHLSPFSLLDEDCFRAVLLRTRASDLPNLRLSCRRIRSVMNSELYRKERSDYGYAEIKVDMLSPFERYKMNRSDFYGKIDSDDEERKPPSEEDKDFIKDFDRLGYVGEYGDHEWCSRDFRVFVDGWPLHIAHKSHPRQFKLKLQLLPRRFPFYEICDSHSQELANLGTLLFTNLGNLRVQSLMNALPVDHKLPLLYIAEFEMPFEYRSTSSTVGPMILQSLLKILKDEYSLAIYIPYGDTQQTKEEMYAENSRDPNALLKEKQTEGDIRERKERRERFNTLTHQDMRQLFRAGFAQVNDGSVVDTDNNYYVFITSQGVNESIRTEQQALDMPISSPPPPPPEKTGLQRELFHLIMSKCSGYSDLEKTIKCWQHPPEEIPMIANTLQQSRFDEMMSKAQMLRDDQNTIEAKMENVTRRKESMVEMKERLETLRGVDDFSPVVEIFLELNQELNSSSQIQHLETPSISIENAHAIIDNLEAFITKQEQTLTELEQILAGSIPQISQMLSEVEQGYEKVMGPLRDLVKKTLKDTETKLEAFFKDVRDGVQSILNRADSDESRYQLILTSDAIHACVARENLTFIKMLLEFLPEPSKQSSLVLNNLDQHGFTPLMVFAQMAPKRKLEDDSLKFAESLIKFGADKNVVQTRTGLSALGCFREGCRNAQSFRATFGFHDPNSVSRGMVESSMEQVLTPDKGPTEADEAVFIAENIEFEDTDDGSEDWDDMESEEEEEEEEEE